MNRNDLLHRTRLTVLVLGILGASVSLAGCTISVAEGPAASSPAADRSGDEAGPADGTDAGDGQQTDAGDDESGTPSSGDGILQATSEQMEKLHRTTWADAVQQHLVCTSDPYTLDNNSDGAVVEIAGECGEVVIKAHAAVVMVPAVTALTVEGQGGIVIAESASRITLTSDATLVGWEKGTPEVFDEGYLNVTTPIE